MRIKTSIKIAVGIALAHAAALQAEDQKLVREAGARYQKTCMACHQPPDLRFASDRVWLGQIRETA